MRKILASAVGLAILLLYLAASFTSGVGSRPAQEVSLSSETGECLECHELYTPGIVADWRTSLHARTTPDAAMTKDSLARRVSAESVPEKLRGTAVGCYECHGLNPDAHKDGFEHEGYKISVVISPKDCATCHPQEEREYGGGKKAHALDNLRKNPVYDLLVEDATSVKHVSERCGIAAASATAASKGAACYACHGTEVGVEGMKTVEAYDGTEMQVPALTNWPNQGVGRINPDGALGACTACHPRHSFSIEVARKPYTCLQCHLNPDVPGWEVFRESKHGNILMSLQTEWEWKNVPWVPGSDFKAPSCAACHSSLLVNTDREVLAQRTHDFGARLYVRLFGVIYSHPQPTSGATHMIVNADGLPLATSFDGRPAAEYLIDGKEAEQRRQTLISVCRACHGTSWAQGHFQQLEAVIADTDAAVLAATRMMQYAWENGLADNKHPFDEALEKKWVAQWLFYANSVRYAAAMSGPDYAAFKNGWWHLTDTLQQMREAIKLKEGLKK